jgi:hypothetical protein
LGLVLNVSRLWAGNYGCYILGLLPGSNITAVFVWLVIAVATYYLSFPQSRWEGIHFKDFNMDPRLKIFGDDIKK